MNGKGYPEIVSLYFTEKLLSSVSSFEQIFHRKQSQLGAPLSCNRITCLSRKI